MYPRWQSEKASAELELDREQQSNSRPDRSASAGEEEVLALIAVSRATAFIVSAGGKIPTLRFPVKMG